MLKHAEFDSWIMTRCAPSSDLPDWYMPGEHDRDLVRAAARYGITRTEFYYVQDADFSFKRYLYKYLKHIEKLMEEEGGETASAGQDPIQYYFQNQAKIQVTFKEKLAHEAEKRKRKEKIKEEKASQKNDDKCKKEPIESKKREKKKPLVDKKNKEVKDEQKEENARTDNKGI